MEARPEFAVATLVPGQTATPTPTQGPSASPTPTATSVPSGESNRLYLPLVYRRR